MENSFDRVVEMFKDSGADSLMVEPSSLAGMLVGMPFDSKTGTCWEGMMMISSEEDAKTCKYPVYERTEEHPPT